MSPTLWGPHRLANCEACGWEYRIHWPASGTLRCFKCGRLGLGVSETTQAGDRVWIDRGAYLLSPPRRGDLVAIEMPSGGLQVKRVVGLPGEVVKICPDGKVLVDDQPLRLSPTESWERSIVVDDDHNPGTEASRWRLSAGEDWLTYHHRDVYNPAGSSDAGPRIRDDDPANASLSRQTHPVEDLQLAVHVVAAAPCTLEVAFATNDSPRVAAIELEQGAQTVRLAKLGATLWLLPPEAPSRLLSDHGAAAQAPLAATERPPVDLARPVALRLRGARRPQRLGPEQLGPTRLWLGRSVRFDPPRAFAAVWRQGVRVAAGRYLVLGDNPPASLDSRSAPEGVAEERILGRVHRWPDSTSDSRGRRTAPR
ncbi:S26 family signal peptidase [Candidatus Laterigemmans baculatus]|uniref:S26 family signal peptidase n=1 Tax=Candidatus Laterigemmans baculatus TaxID=2770505 RepID=UPI00193B7D37|nr:S26 family signal peptidase [Candidatus Laterigemmans baculatus]